MIAGLEEKDLEEIWNSVSTDHQLPTTFSNKNLKTVTRITQLLTDAYRNSSTQPIEQSSLKPEEKRSLTDFVREKIEQKGPELDLDWKISIIVGNQYVQKSLHPIVELGIEGERLELDMEGLAQMRLALAKALLSTDKYSNQ